MMSGTDDIFSYCLSFTNLEKRPLRSEYRLDRMKELLDLADHPEESFRSVHIAGSKGKGSTAAFLSSLLSRPSCRVGIYASPHVYDWQERIRIREGSTTLHADGYLRGAFEVVQDCVSRLQHSAPTTFELLTLLAFISFREARCEWGVVETGLGGRLDATNLIRPCYSIITSIELEHQDYLGDSLEEIAKEKAGIVKTAAPVIVPTFAAPVSDIIAARARAQRSTLYRLEEHLDRRSEGDTTCYTFSLRGRDETLCARLRMAGAAQTLNAALALLTYLLTGGDKTPQEIAQALEGTTLPGRTEFVAGDPPMLLDGAHTPESIGELCRTFFGHFPDGGNLLIGITQRKNTGPIAKVLKQYFSRAIVTEAGSFKPYNPYELAKILQKERIHTEVYPEASQALQIATADGKPTLVTGSFHLIGNIHMGSYRFEKRVYCLQGDITKMNVDCIVNAANSSLLGGGGVDGALHRAGGPRILEECRRIREQDYPDGLPAGEAVHTNAGDLSARYVIHTVGPIWKGGGQNEEQILLRAYENSLRVARELGTQSVAFPAISTGAFSFPKEKAFGGVAALLGRYCENHSSPETIYLVFFQHEDLALFTKICR